MKKSTLVFDFLAIFIMISLTGCAVGGGIFTAGVGFGIFMAVLVVTLVIWLISRVG